jgi:spore maturation protein CgeB
LARVLVVGKTHCLVYMTENTVEAFRQAGAQVECFALNGDHPAFEFYLKYRGKLLGDAANVVAERLRRKILTCQPDLIVFVLGAWQDEKVYQAAKEARPEAVRVAWVGDVFTPEEGIFARYMDWVFCTDSYFMESLKTQGAVVPSSYLPLAMDPNRFFPLDLPRSDRVVYVAKNSPGRAAIVSQIHRPLALYGRKWRKLKAPQHEIHVRDVALADLPEIYASCCAVLNIKNERNVVKGVNQRSFEPYGCKTPVLNDDVEDLPLCMEPGREILVYRSLDELQDWHERLIKDNAFARAIGEAGYRRVMAEHTYRHRAQHILRQMELD